MTDEEIDKLPELDLKEIPNPACPSGRDKYLFVLASENKEYNHFEYLLTTGEVVKGYDRYPTKDVDYFLNAGYICLGIGILHKRPF